MTTYTAVISIPITILSPATTRGDNTSPCIIHFLSFPPSELSCSGLWLSARSIAIKTVAKLRLASDRYRSSRTPWLQSTFSYSSEFCWRVFGGTCPVAINLFVAKPAGGFQMLQCVGGFSVTACGCNRSAGVGSEIPASAGVWFTSANPRFGLLFQFFRV